MFSSEKSLDIFLKLIDLESVFGPYSNLTVIITPLIRTLKFWNGKMTLVCGHIVTVSTTNVRFIYVFVICTENKHRIVDSKSIADRDCLIELEIVVKTALHPFYCLLRIVTIIFKTELLSKTLI